MRGWRIRWGRVSKAQSRKSKTQRSVQTLTFRLWLDAERAGSDASRFTLLLPLPKREGSLQAACYAPLHVDLAAFAELGLRAAAIEVDEDAEAEE